MASGLAYTDSMYAPLEAAAEKKYNLTPGLLSRIRTKGERSNADQVSEAGARTVYQIIPSTRDGVIKNYGIDPYSGPSAAVNAAALILREGKLRNHGDEDKAVLEYHGGIDRSQWGPRTRAYGQRVNGSDAGSYVGSDAGSGYTDADRVDQNSIEDYDKADWLRSTPGELSINPKETQEERRVRINKATLGSANMFTDRTINEHDVGADEVRGGQITAAQQTAEDNKLTPWQRLKASWWDNSLTGTIIRHMDDQHFNVQDGFIDKYIANRDKIEAGMNDDEISQLRTSISDGSLAFNQQDIAARRERRALYTGRGASGLDATLYTLVGGLADPIGLAAGEGVGTAFKLAGVGSKALWAKRAYGAATASQAAEFAGANVAITAGMDAAGEYTTPEDYATAAAFGAGLGLATAPFHYRGAARTVEQHFAEQAANAHAEKLATMADAERELGPGATPEQVMARTQEKASQRPAMAVETALADQPDNLKVMSADNVLTKDEELKARVHEEYGLDGIADDSERDVATEAMARLERIEADNPIDEDRLNPLTAKVGWASTGIDLLKSPSKALRALGIILTEGTTGAAGRRRTAAMIQHVRERVYNSFLRGYAEDYHMYRKQQGYGLLSEAWNGKGWKEFEREVFLELERRGDPESYRPHDNPLIREAADKAERGFDAMRIEQQHVGTVGAARLGEHSKGYVPHRVSGAKLASLDKNQRRAVAAEYSLQFQSNEGFDKKFSDKLANKYIEQAIRRAKGGADVPMHLHDPSSADMWEDSLKAMGLPPEELDKLLGKYSRGGAGHTKGRLKLNLDKDIGGGMKMADLYNTSVSDLYRGYSRRVSGEVALAQFGIMGKKGLQTLRALAEATGATGKDLRAFDQVSAEFLNQPFGEHNHKWMDNARIAASLSRLGGMGFTQLGEYGNGIIALGAQRVFSSIADMPRLIKEIRGIHKGNAKPNPILASLDQLGGHLGADEFNNTRLFDVPDNDIKIYGNEGIGLGSRVLRASGNVQAMLSGHRMIMSTQIRGMAEQIVRKAIDYVKSGAEDIALDDMGINAALRERLRANLDKVATFEGGRLKSLDLMAGDLTGHEIMSIRDAVERGAGQIIQHTYIGETGKWAHDGFLKMLTQFRTFGITSIEKQWGRTNATHGALKSFAYTVGAMSFAAPIYMARVQAAMLGMDGAQAQKYADTHLTPMAVALATMNYASSTGMAGDILDMGIGFAGGSLGMELSDDLAARGRSRGGFIGGQIAPGVGLVNDLYSGATNLRSQDGSLNQSSARKLEKALPGSNLPMVQPMWNWIGG
jgi:hypothetical protein